MGNQHVPIKKIDFEAKVIQNDYKVWSTDHVLDDPLTIYKAHVWITINNVFSSHGRSLVYILSRRQSYITSPDLGLHSDQITTLSVESMLNNH